MVKKVSQVRSDQMVKEKISQNYIRDKLLRTTLLAAAFILLLSALAARIVVWIGSKIIFLTAVNWWLNVWQAVFLGGLSIAWMRLAKHWSFREMGFARLNRKMLGLSALNGVLLGASLLFLTGVLSSFMPEQMTAQPLVQAAAEAVSWQEIMGIYLLSSVLAPISEEIFFRGMIYGCLSKQMGRKKALVLTAFCFALLHFDLYRLPLLWAAGLWLNILRVKYGSLYSSMLAHSVWNTLMISLVFIF